MMIAVVPRCYDFLEGTAENNAHEGLEVCGFQVHCCNPHLAIPLERIGNDGILTNNKFTQSVVRHGLILKRQLRLRVTEYLCPPERKRLPRGQKQRNRSHLEPPRLELPLLYPLTRRSNAYDATRFPS